MRNKNPAVIIFGMGLLLLGGCAKPPTPAEIQAANYGAYPDNHEEIVRSYSRIRLKDPESAKYRLVKSPNRGYWGQFGQTSYGYGVCYAIDAKNFFGGYTGEQLHMFVINSGIVIRHFDEAKLSFFKPHPCM